MEKNAKKIPLTGWRGARLFCIIQEITSKSKETGACMPNSLIRTACAAAIALMMAVPGYAGEAVDLTQFFARQTESLADENVKESLFQATGELPGLLQYADTRPREVGDIEVFNTFNILKNNHEKTKAQLKKIGRHCYIYLQQGRKLDAATIDRIAAAFDKRIYPEARSMFGSEWNPGIDNDPKITLLLLDIQDSFNPDQGRKGFTAGYFNAGDCYRTSKFPNSNQREMLYLDVFPGNPSTDKFLSVIAHEFQHMIHWNYDPKEFNWVNESLSQLAPFLCGYGHPPQVEAFIRNPDNNLVAWSDDDTIANYGQVYLWASYISTRIASTDDRRRAFVRRMVAQTSQGFSGLNAAIKKQGIKNNARNLFRSFCVANYLNDDRIERGAYGYDKALARLALKPEIKFDAAPFEGKSSVKCWSAKAVQINPAVFRGKQIRVAFAGQKISAGDFSNDFDVAVVGYSAAGSVEPTVTWLNIKDFKASDAMVFSQNHDRMMLVVVNRGPEIMKVEQAFARGSAPAAFSFAVRRITANRDAPAVASARTSSTGANRVNRARARSIMEEITAGISIDESAGILLSADETSDRSAAAIEYDFAFQKIAAAEDEIVNAVRDGLSHGDAAVVEEFTGFYGSCSDENKAKLQTLKNRLRDILRFEQMQGNARAAELLAAIES